MKKKILEAFRIIFAVIFMISVGYVICLVLEDYDARRANSQAQEIAGATDPSAGTTSPENTPPEQEDEPLPPDEHTPYMQGLDIPALQAVNGEVIGWIYIPGVDINHPLMHTTDNDKYLYTTWDGDYNADGSIFLETKCAPDLTDFNTIIYGHNMYSGTMFAPLHRYRDHSYYQEHPYIYIATKDKIYRYEIFSAYEAGVTTDTYRLWITGDAKTPALEHYITSSVWEAELTPTTDDFILTLSTCTGTGRYETRWVVQAALNGTWDKE